MIAAVGAAAAPEAEDTSTTCLVCWDAGRDAVLLECGHSGMCVACAQRIWRGPTVRRICPICRRGFAAVLRILREEHGVVSAPSSSRSARKEQGSSSHFFLAVYSRSFSPLSLLAALLHLLRS
jgi:hypothetical protein